MLDHLRLMIKVQKPFYLSNGSRHYYNGDILALGLPCATRHVSRTDDGQVLTGELYHPFESLPSDFTDMAMKFYTIGVNSVPYVELKASPLKLLQGHNVFGFECIKTGALEMLGMLLVSYPKLCQVLDFGDIEVGHLDVTYFAKLPHQNMVQPVLDFMSKISKGHRKCRQVKHENYVTWGNEHGRYINIKSYGKFIELQSQLDEITKKAFKGCKRSQSIANAMSGVLEFSKGHLRFESRICKTYLSKNGYPTNLWKLIDFQAENPNFLQELWHVSFNPIMSSLEGENMVFSSDEEVLDLLKSKLWTVTKKGNKSYTKANNAFKFYTLIKQLGFEKVKSVTVERTFYENVKNLVDCGISRSHLQNLHDEQGAKVIPFVRLVEIKFGEQLPSDYQMPVSRFSGLYDELRSIA